ncbi:aminotransferase-like domain-containing protein [Asticcacaulis endophyticus]|uniref:Transcriptional regulator n=1 Tax=Asticcacaulis endophyticus TaxID=1395890 RepID=A0A918ULF6_9CAUL|nr:PLP-dependent aminotransferase family protein [Asticcacaulis endophyticus]GGZ20303.1 transcriptional regulator [Asticcacaulis endophyticus]
MAFDLTLTQQVMTVIRDQIARRQLSAGARLPSIRAFAEAQNVSKSTVVEAYDRLLAEGVITARRGSGYYVASAFAPLSLAEIGPRLDRQVDPLWVSRQSLETRDYLKPGCGWLPASWMPEDDIRRALRALARNPKADLLDYSTPAGHAGLRQILTRRLAEKDIDVSPGQIILMDSATQAIELLCRFLLKPGDTVLLDDPCYFNFLAKLRAHKVNVVGVPYTPNGPDMAALTAALETHRPRLYLTNTSMHNPTGASLSPINAHRLLKLAEAYDLTIIEDDIYSDFELEPGPRLSAFDGFERVVYVGGFSKALSASIRLGYIAARPDWIEALTDLKIATLFSSQTFAAELVCQVLSDGHYRKHLDTLRQKLAAVRGPTAERLEKLGLKPWLRPQAGMFLWCELPEGYDASDLARQALNERIVLAPGNAFSVNQTATRFMRFNIAQSQDERLFAFLKSHLRT